jgi:hypothetical protein
MFRLVAAVTIVTSLALCSGFVSSGVAAGEISLWKHNSKVAQAGCVYQGRSYSNGATCSTSCDPNWCKTQWCNNGTWQAYSLMCAVSTHTCPGLC